MPLNDLLVSVIVPTFNCADILSKCLDSIVVQDYSNLEIIVMDGGSTDDTQKIARSYGDRVKVVSEPDQGIYDAMNKGVATSSGEWLFFIGADDSFAAPDVVSQMMASEGAKNSSTLLLYGDVDSPSLGPRYQGEVDFAGILRNNICHQAIFHRRRLFEIEGLYSLRYRLLADWDLNARVFARHPKAHRYVDCVVANYTGGLSNHVVDEAFAAEFSQNLLRYTDAGRGVRDRDVRAVVYAREIAWFCAHRYRRQLLRTTIKALWRSSILRQVAMKRIPNPWRS